MWRATKFSNYSSNSYRLDHLYKQYVNYVENTRLWDTDDVVSNVYVPKHQKNIRYEVNMKKLK